MTQLGSGGADRSGSDGTGTGTGTGGAHVVVVRAPALAVKVFQNCLMKFQASPGTQLVVCPGSLGTG